MSKEFPGNVFQVGYLAEVHEFESWLSEEDHENTSFHVDTTSSGQFRITVTGDNPDEVVLRYLFSFFHNSELAKLMRATSHEELRVLIKDVFHLGAIGFLPKESSLRELSSGVNKLLGVEGAITLEHLGNIVLREFAMREIFN